MKEVFLIRVIEKSSGYQDFEYILPDNFKSYELALAYIKEKSVGIVDNLNHNSAQEYAYLCYFKIEKVITLPDYIMEGIISRLPKHEL